MTMTSATIAGADDDLGFPPALIALIPSLVGGLFGGKGGGAASGGDAKPALDVGGLISSFLPMLKPGGTQSSMTAGMTPEQVQQIAKQAALEAVRSGQVRTKATGGGCRVTDRYSAQYGLCYDPLRFASELDANNTYRAQGPSTSVAPAPGAIGPQRAAAPAYAAPRAAASAPTRARRARRRRALRDGIDLAPLYDVLGDTTTPEPLTYRAASAKECRTGYQFDAAGKQCFDARTYDYSQKSPSILKLGAVLAGGAAVITGAILLLNRARRPRFAHHSY